MVAATTVRIAGPHERIELGALLGDLLEHHGPGPRYDVDSAAGDREAGLGGLLAPYLGHRDGRVFVVDGSEGPVALLCAAIARREQPFAERRRGQIEHLVVRPEARRQGLGRALVEEALGWFRASGVTRIELQVDARNPSGQAFWRQMGFGEVAHVLERRL